jgi:hypothetical protein
MGVGLSLKLLLVPFQFFALSFYQLLPLPALLVYLVVYYGPFFVSFMGLLVGGLGLMLAPWVLLLACSLLLAALLVLSSLPTQTGLATLLASSTVVNLMLLLLGFIG